MQIPIARGRDIDSRDTGSSPMAVVVNEAFAARHMAGKDPVGHSLRLIDSDKSWGVIVGVAKDTVLYSLRNHVEPVVFPVYSQHLDRISNLTFLLRSAGDSLPLAGAARQIAEAVDPRIPVTNLRTVDAQIRRIIGQERSFAFLCSAFAALALLIACVGLYATLAYGVSRRTGEIGVRIALGADRGRVVAMVLRESAFMIAAGVAIGLPFVRLSGKLIESFLFRTAPDDPFALAGPALVLLAAALIASGIPAWRAARIDPMTALRHE
jgi:macrolide transport system ATP-binding/permease protein